LSNETAREELDVGGYSAGTAYETVITHYANETVFYDVAGIGTGQTHRVLPKTTPLIGVLTLHGGSAVEATGRLYNITISNSVGSGASGDITLLYPANNKTNNTNPTMFGYNFSSGSADIDTIQLWTNTTGGWTVNGTNTTYINDSESNFLLGLPQGDTLWSITANDTLGNNYSSVNYSVDFDTTSPSITDDGSPIFSNEFFVLDTSVGGNSHLVGTINVTDDNLFSINISTDVETVYYNTSYDTNLLVYNLSLDVENYSIGEHNLTVFSADGHTAKSIGDYDYIKPPLSNSVKFLYDRPSILKDRNYIEINPDKGRLDVNKLQDRYSFKYSSLTTTDSLVFDVKSSQEIHIIKDSEYKAHLVVLEPLYKWIDFNLEQAKGTETYNVERISPYHVRVTVQNLNSKSLTFNSIGDLNTQTVTYQFNVIGANESFVSPVAEATNNEFLLNFTANSSYNISATLLYNNTYRTATKTTTADSQAFNVSVVSPTLNQEEDNITFQWNFSIVGNQNTQDNVTNSTNQTVQQVLLTQCDAGSVLSRNYTFMDEDNHEYLNANVSVVIEYTSAGVTRNYTRINESVDNFPLCIQPSYANLTADMILQYTATNGTYDIRERITQSDVFDNETDNEILYSLASSRSTDIVVTLKDNNDNAIPDYIVQTERFNVSNSKYYVAETDITDSDGNSILQMVVDNEFYRFTILKDNEQQYQSDRFKITQTAYTFIIGGGSDSPLRDWLLTQKVVSSLDYDNNTQVFSFDYEDPEDVATTFCLNVSYGNGSVAGTSCSEENSSSLTYTVSTLNETYIASGYATINNVAKKIQTTSVDLSNLWRGLGTTTSLLLTIIVVLTFTLLGAKTPKLAVTMMIVSLTFVKMIGLASISMVQLVSIAVVGIIVISLMKEGLGT